MAEFVRERDSELISLRKTTETEQKRLETVKENQETEAQVI